MTTSADQIPSIVANVLAEVRASNRYIGARWNDLLYGPAAAPVRARIASAIIGHVVTKSSETVQWGNFCRLLAGAVGVTSWTCIRDLEEQVQTIIDRAGQTSMV